MTIYKTKRLRARLATINDSKFILKLLNEPSWKQFIADHSIDTQAKAADYIEEKLLASYANFGFGLWVIEKIDQTIPIGLCGLLQRDSLPCADLGFAFLSDYWGQGYAAEAAAETLHYAKNVLRAQQVMAITDKANAHSIKLLEKIGFVYESTFSHPGSNEVLSLYSNSIH